MTGTIIDTRTLWPGASTPPDGLKTIWPGTLVKAVQCRSFVAVALSVTRARQIYAPFLFVQSRCPTKLIDDGRKSRIGGMDTGGDVGCGACVATGVGLGITVGLGVGVIVGLTDVAVAAGTLVVAGTCFVWLVGAEPQEARTITIRARPNHIILFLFVSSIEDENDRINSSRILSCHILVNLSDKKTCFHRFFITEPHFYTGMYV